MRIAQVTPVYPPYRGGMGSVAHEYTERLQALGHEVEVFSPKWKIGNAGFLSWCDVKRLSTFNVVHVHYPFYGGAEQVVLFCRKPIVMTYHMDAKAGGAKGFFFNAHRFFLQPLLLAKAKKILVSSLDYAKHSGLAKFRRTDHIVEMPFGVDIRRFHPVATDQEVTLRSALSIPAEAPVLLFVGGLDSAHLFKGVSVLLEAFARIASTDAHLVIVGEGNLKGSFQAAAMASNQKNRIHFVGSQTPEDLPVYYRMASVHVFPSTSAAEAFGLVALEAAASGIPTVGSYLPGVRTVVKNEETGLLVSPSNVEALTDAINRLLNDASLREKLGGAARKRVVAEYSWDTLVERLIGLYRDLNI